MISLCRNELMSWLCDSRHCRLYRCRSCCRVQRSSDPIFGLFWRYCRRKSFQAEAIAMSGPAHDMMGNVCDSPVSGLFKIRSSYPIVECSHRRTAPDLKILPSVLVSRVCPIRRESQVPAEDERHHHFRIVLSLLQPARTALGKICLCFFPDLCNRLAPNFLFLLILF